MRSTMLAGIAALALMGPALADSVVITKPGLTLAGPKDNITNVTITYSASNGTAQATFHVQGGAGYPSGNVTGRFDTAQAALQAAQDFNNAHGGYQLGDAGGAISIKNSTKTVKALRPGIDGIVRETAKNSPYGTAIRTSFYHDTGVCTGWCGGPSQNVAMVSQAKGNTGAGGSWGSARSTK
jgi:hypothetical protein